VLGESGKDVGNLNAGYGAAGCEEEMDLAIIVVL